MAVCAMALLTMLFGNGSLGSGVRKARWVCRDIAFGGGRTGCIGEGYLSCQKIFRERVYGL
jgi:hypothetical protein